MRQKRQRPSSFDEGEGKLRQIAELRAIYARTEALTDGLVCDASTDCCRFGVTGREPYPTAIEIAELERGIRARGGLKKRRSLPVAGERRCAMLDDSGRCQVYASRPFGCRTFFCDRARDPNGNPVALPREAVAALSRAIADLSARFDPRDPGPRPLSRRMDSWLR